MAQKRIPISRKQAEFLLACDQEIKAATQKYSAAYEAILRASDDFDPMATLAGLDLEAGEMVIEVPDPAPNPRKTPVTRVK